MVLRWLIALLVVATVSAACGPKPAESADATPVPIASADLSGSGPGTLVSAMSMPVLGQSSEGRTFDAARVVYRSTNGDTGEGTEVSGSVFVPKGTAPDGGWPVISFGHGTTGLDEPCGPSLSATLLGFTTIVAGYVSKGYAVALADYQGLGAPGHHPYTDSKTAGLNMIDAVRALRHTVDGVSDRWAAVGGSQGGGAAWAADEQAASYAPELKLVGAVAYVPAADVTGLVDKAVAGTMTTDQSLAFQGIVESLARLHPDVVRDDYRRGAAATYWDVLSACSGPKTASRDAAAAAVRSLDFAPASPAAADRLRESLRAWALPQQRLSAPLSVTYAGRDEFIDAQWTTDAIARACALGGTVVWQLQPDKGHGDVDVASRFDWIADRFAGIPASNDCPGASGG
ncbi:lipase family protein [Mycobacterium antarcticum]|uniref:lipase family protein n=1 Tax=Mycolicibacterium sp. TUM20984 TaxID=3023368 RepID=UPI0023859C1B|nr:lipase family protein [Mycolicibacterium sp. TUM20984]GLP82538.1 putative lipase [Mycolicibacterium sp. TUM20984]